MSYPYFGAGKHGTVSGHGSFETYGHIHGQNSEAHRREMVNAAEMVVATNVPDMIENLVDGMKEKKKEEIVPRLCAEIYNDSLTRLIGAINYDVNTAVDISIGDMGELVAGSKLSKFMSDVIMKEMKVHLKSIKGITIK